MGKVSIPIITSNRINTPQVAEEVLKTGCADMVSMARPFLADPDFIKKLFPGMKKRLRRVLPATKPVWIILLVVKLVHVL